MTLSEFVKEGIQRPLVMYPNILLNTPVEILEGIEEDKYRAAQIMFSIMYHARGIGLAANQVNLDCAMFVMNYTGDSTKITKQKVCINPKILSYGEKEVILEEQCLSFPRTKIGIKRPKSISVQYETPEGLTITELLETGESRVFQHEYDHLRGVTILEHIGKRENNNV